MTSFFLNPVSGSILGRSLPIRSVSAIQGQADGLVTNFIVQATELKTLGALTAGGLAYRFGKLAALSAGTRYLSGVPSLVRIGSVGMGLAGESATFAGVQRGFRVMEGQGSSQSFGKEWLGAAISLGSLKFFGKLGEGQNLPLQHLFTDFGMIGAHQVAFLTGLEAKPEGDLSSQLLHAEAMNWQMKAGISLVHGLAPQLAASERAMDLTLKTRENDLASFGSGIFHPLYETPAFATEGAPSVLLSKPLDGNPKGPTLMAMSSLKGSGETGLQRKDYPHVEEKTFTNSKGEFRIKLFSREPIQDIDDLVRKFGLSFMDLLLPGQSSILKGPLAALIRGDPNIQNALKDFRFKSFELQVDVQGEEMLALRMYQGEVRWELSVAKAQLKTLEASEADKKEKELLKKLNTPIEELDLPTRAKNIMGNEGILYLGELIQYPEKYVEKQIKNLGKRTLHEIKEFLATIGLSLGMKVAWKPPSVAHFLNIELLHFVFTKGRALLSYKSEGNLRSVGILYLGQLVQATEKDLSEKIRPNELEDIKNFLRMRGLSFGMSLDWTPPIDPLSLYERTAPTLRRK